MASAAAPGGKRRPTIPHLDLYNFEEAWAKETQYVLTSPRSLEACNRCGAQPVQLLYKSLKDFELEMADENLLYTELYDCYQRYEKARQEKLKEARDERQRIIWSSQENDSSSVSDRQTTKHTARRSSALTISSSSPITDSTSSLSSVASYSSQRSSTNQGISTTTTARRKSSRLPAPASQDSAGKRTAASVSSQNPGGTLAHAASTMEGEEVLAPADDAATAGRSSGGATDPASPRLPRSGVLQGHSSRVHFTQKDSVAMATTASTSTGSGSSDGKKSTETSATSSSAPDGPAPFRERRKMELVGQRLELQPRPFSSLSRTSSAAPPPPPTETKPGGDGSTDESQSPSLGRRSAETTRTRHRSVPSAARSGRTNMPSTRPTDDGTPPSSSSAVGVRKDSTPARAWNSADGALLARAKGGGAGTATTSSESSLWSTEELAEAVISVGMSSMEARKMALLSEKDRRILQKMVERRRREAEHRVGRMVAEETWSQQAEKRRVAKQLEEQELRLAVERKREKERVELHQRKAEREQAEVEEVDALQQEMEERDEKWAQLYDARQRQVQAVVQENAERGGEKKRMQELRRAELLAQEVQQRRAMLEQHEARIETAAEVKVRLEREELERLRARNAAEKMAVASRLKEIEEQEAEEMLLRQSEVVEKHQRAEERLLVVQEEKGQLVRSKAEKRDRQSERNRQAARQLEAENEQLRLAVFEERLLAEQRAAETALQNVEERSEKAAEALQLRQAAHSRNLGKIRQEEEEEQRQQQHALAEKEVRMESLAREREAVVRGSRERALEAELLRDKLRQYCMSDTFDRKAAGAKLGAAMEEPGRRVIRTATQNQSSSKIILG